MWQLTPVRHKLTQLVTVCFTPHREIQFLPSLA